MENSATELHSRFQFDRLDTWQKEEVIKRKKEQANLRKILAAQVADKKRQKALIDEKIKEEERRLEQNIQRHNAEATQSIPTITQANATGIRKATESTWGSSSGLVDPVVSTVATCSSNVPEQSTAAPVVDELQGTGNGVAHHSRFQFSRLEPWKQSEHKKKQLEQARVREDLAAQIAEKQRRVMQAKAEQEARDAADEAAILRQQKELMKTFEEHASRNPFSPTNQERQNGISAVPDRSPRRVPRANATIQESNTNHDQLPKISTEETTENIKQTIVDDDTLEFLKQQVLEQQKLLKEQSSVMTNLRELAEAAKSENDETREEMQRLRDALEDRSSNMHQQREADVRNSKNNPTRKSCTGEMNQEKRSKQTTAAPNVRKKPRNPKQAHRLNKTTVPKATKRMLEMQGRKGSTMNSKTDTRHESQLQVIPVTLMRDGGGYLRVELENVSGRSCIKRVRKSLVRDERNLLESGDLIVALGGYKVRAALKSNAEMLRQLPQVPTHEEVGSVFKKSGNLVHFAVCRVSRSDIIVAFPCDDRTPVVRQQRPQDLSPTPQTQSGNSSPSWRSKEWDTRQRRVGKHKTNSSVLERDEGTGEVRLEGSSYFHDVSARVPFISSPGNQALPEALDQFIPHEVGRNGMSTRERNALLSSSQPNKLEANSVMVLEHCFDPETNMLTAVKTIDSVPTRSSISKYGERALMEHALSP